MNNPRWNAIERIVIAYIRKGHPAYGLAALTLILATGLAGLALLAIGGPQLYAHLKQKPVATQTAPTVDSRRPQPARDKAAATALR